MPDDGVSVFPSHVPVSRRSALSGGLKLAGGAGLLITASGLGFHSLMARAQGATPAGAPMMGGVAVDPQLQEVLDVLASFNNPPIEQTTPDVARNLPSFANALAIVEQQKGVVTAPKVAIQGMAVPGSAGDIPCRMYKPSSVAAGSAMPVVVYFHGGGFVIANLDTYEHSCLAIADMAQCLVVSVGYRQAPEHPFTAAVDDAYAVTQYVLSNANKMGGDASKVAVLGESAGGNLATVVCLKAKDEGGKMPIHQVLVFPITTYDPTGDQTASITQFADAKPLNSAMLDWFKKYYLPKAADAQNAYSSPLLAPDLGGLPPATVIQAEIDPLQSQGTAYANALKAAGVTTSATIYNGMTHEFFGMGTVVDKAKQAEMDAAQALMTAFAGGSATPSA
jgi:acetyl esterase